METLGQLARSGLGFLLSALKDANPSVKNTTAWTIGEGAVVPLCCAMLYGCAKSSVAAPPCCVFLGKKPVW